MVSSFKNNTRDQMTETLGSTASDYALDGRFSALLGVTHTILIRHQTLTLNITNILLGRFSSFGGSGLHSINRQRHRHQMYLTMSVETSYQGGQCPCLATWSCLELSSSPVGADTHSTLLLLLPAGPLLSSWALTTKMTSYDIKCSNDAEKDASDFLLRWSL